ncbi:MAG: putative quinol monooxygenase [Bryobacteraceae bacterium]|nr:putative quinol monooxygenase [Bryobacteraceae bacterium]
MNLVTVVATFKTRPGLEDTARQTLIGLVEPTRREPGCVLYDLHESTEFPGVFVFFEKWVDMQALDLHKEMPYLHALREKVAELFLESPDVRTYSRLA